MGSNCNLWYTDSHLETGAATPLLTNKLLSPKKVPCNKRLIVLCIEIIDQHPRRRRKRHEFDSAADLQKDLRKLEFQDENLFEFQDRQELDDLDSRKNGIHSQQERVRQEFSNGTIF